MKGDGSGGDYTNQHPRPLSHVNEGSGYQSHSAASLSKWS